MPAHRPEVFEQVEIVVDGVPAAANPFDPDANFWPRHPYNAANGGPCQTQNDFFTNAAARKLYEKRLRYLVARYAAFPNLFAWEWLLDRACDWPEGAAEASPQAVNGARVSLTGVDDGEWSVEWWDTLTGKRLAEGVTTASGGVLRLEPPEFRVDLAARLKKR